MTHLSNKIFRFHSEREKKSDVQRCFDEIILEWILNDFFSFFSELEMDTENVVEMDGQQTILKNSLNHDKMDR